MNQGEIAGLMKALAPIIGDFVIKALEPVTRRLKAVEDRDPLKGDKGDPGDRGVDGAPGRDGIDGKDGESGLDGKDGAPGLDGKDGAPGEPGGDGPAGPQGERGEKGDPGERGTDGAPGEAGKDGEPGPQGERGANGDPGERGTDGAPGPKGEKGDPGRDGRDASDLAVVREMVADQVAKGVAAALATMTLSSPDDGRTLVVQLQAGATVVKAELTTALLLDRGVWKEGQFQKGDGVTWGGSFFIAQRDTSDKPETSDAWRLSVKRGRDGRDGKEGKAGAVGAKGDKGERGYPGMNA